MSPQDLAALVGRNVRRLRRAKGLTQPALTARCGWPAVSAISKIEHGAMGLTLARLAQLALALGVEPAALLCDDAADRPAPRLDAALLQHARIMAVEAYDAAARQQGQLSQVLNALALAQARVVDENSGLP